MSLFQFQKSPQSQAQNQVPRQPGNRLRTFLLGLNLIVSVLLLAFILFWAFIKPPFLIISGSCPEPLEKHGFACEPCQKDQFFNPQTKTCQKLNGLDSCAQTFNQTRTPWIQTSQAFTYNKEKLTSQVCQPASSLRGLYRSSFDSFEFIKSCDENTTFIRAKLKFVDTDKTVKVCTGQKFCSSRKNEDISKVYNHRHGNECSDSCDSFGDEWVYTRNQHGEKLCQPNCPNGYALDKHTPSECIALTAAKRFYQINNKTFVSTEDKCDPSHPYTYSKDNKVYCTASCGTDIGHPFLDQSSQKCLSECKLQVKDVNGQKVCAPSSKIIATPPTSVKSNPAENVNNMINALIRPEKKALERYQQTLRSDNLNPDQAHLLIKQTISQWPEEDASYTAAADYWIRNNDPKQALRLLTWRPYPIADHIDYYSTLAYAFLINNNEKSAQQIYDSLVRIEPKNAKWWLGLGTSYDHMGKKPQAFKSWRKAYFYADKNAEYVSFLESKLQSEDSEA